MKIKLFLFSLFISFFSLMAGAFDIKEGELDNGLKVIFIPSKTAPAIYHSVWYKVGSIHEDPQYTGVSHLLEHMLFKGTEKFPEGAISRIVEEHGGMINAMTSYEFTAYFEFVPKELLETVMEMEADRMENVTIDPDELITEIDIVLDERLMVIDNIPTNLFIEKADKEFWREDPRSRGVIGSPETISAITPEIAEEYHKIHYAPNNAVLVVAGDAEFDEVMELAEKHYGPIPAKKLPEPVQVYEPDHLEAKKLVYRHERMSEPNLHRWILAPKFDEENLFEESLTLEVLSKILGGETGRVYERLVMEENLAIDAGFQMNSFLKGGRDAYGFYATAHDEKDADRIFEIFSEIIEDLKENPITEEEVKKVTMRAADEVTFMSESMLYTAFVVSNFYFRDISMDKVRNYTEYMEQVTAEDIRKMVERMFGEYYPTDIIMAQAEVEEAPAAEEEEI